MAESLFKTGDYVELKPCGENGLSANAGSKESYESVVTNVGRDNTVTVSLPRIGNQTVPLEEGEEYLLRFIVSSGSYECRGVVEDDSSSPLGSGYVIRLLSELTRDRKRMFFRLDKVIPVLYSLQGKESEEDNREETEEEEEKQEEKQKGTCFNISAGGLRFASNTDIERGENIKIYIPFGDTGREICVTGSVIYTDNVDRENAGFEHRVRFADIDFDTAESLARYCFDEACK